MNNTTKKRPVGEWFAECGNHNSNNGLAEALAARGFGYDVLGMNVEVLCNDNVKRPMFCIPGAFVQRMIRAKKGGDVLEFRFWKRDHADVPAYPMNFIEEQGSVRRSAKFKSGADKLKAERAARADQEPK